MADIQTVWGEQVATWVVQDGDLASDDGLQTAVIISLFTDALASDQEAAAAGVPDRRGWWADAYPQVVGDQIGSRLWLLAREKRLPAVLDRARGYAAAALQWLVDDGVAESVSVSAEVVREDILGLAVEIQRRGRPVARYRFDSFWKGI